jgi:hypothetical protein
MFYEVLRMKKESLGVGFDRMGLILWGETGGAFE